MDTTLWLRNEDWVGTDIESSFVMVHLTNGRYLTFNETARVAWAMLENPCSQKDIEQKLLSSFEVGEEECSRDVGELLQRMRDLEIVAPA